MQASHSEMMGVVAQIAAALEANASFVRGECQPETTSHMTLLMDGCDSPEAPTIGVWKGPDARTWSVESSLTMPGIAWHLCE